MRFPKLVATLGGVQAALSRARGVVFERTGDEATDRALDRFAEALRPLLAHPRADSTILRDQAFSATTPLAIPHRLGRTFSGWSVSRLRAASATNVTIREVTQSPASLDAQTVTLEATAACTADIEVW